MLQIDYHTILLWATSILILSFDLIIYIGSNNKSSRLFCFFSMIVALWSLSYGFFISITSSEIPLILIKINHCLGIIATIGFIFFSHSYPHDTKIPSRLLFRSTLFGSIYCIIILFSDLIISGMFNIAVPDRWGWIPGIFYPSYVIIFSGSWIYILTRIGISKKYAKSKYDYLNSKFMFWGLLLGIIPPLFLNIILPAFKTYGVSWTGPIASAIWVFVIGYSIMRYRQMNVKVVITEMLAVAMTIIYFINIFVKAEVGTAQNVATFFVFLLIATYLIRTVLSEAKTKEQLRELNNTLEDKVNQQTKEIRKSFELEKHARRELEKLNDTKNQFIMITQHSIRSPLQNLKNNLREVDDKSRTSIDQNLHRLTEITNDFLNISTIDDSRKLLNTEKLYVLNLIDKILIDLKFDIDAKNIHLAIDRNPSSWPTINADKSKLYEALLIIIENAIKYNKPNGHININALSNSESCQITISDSGIGLSKDDLNKVNSSHFYRSDKAKQLNPIGMGIGLSVAKTIIQAHHGSLIINSPGCNSGTIATINLPIDYFNNLETML